MYNLNDLPRDNLPIYSLYLIPLTEIKGRIIMQYTVSSFITIDRDLGLDDLLIDCLLP